MSEKIRPRAFAVWFKDLKRWSVNSFSAVDWQWPAECIHPLGTALTRRQVAVDRKQNVFKSLQLATIRFDGSIEPRNTEGKADFKGALFVAEAGDILYSKIDVRNGAIGIVPPGLPCVAVSSEFPVYQVKPEVADPQYITLLFRTAIFRRTINSMISGTSGRKRVQPEQLEEIKIPLPPLPIQQAIVARWEAAQANIRTISDEFLHAKGVTSRLVLDCLGIPVQEFRALPKAFALNWKDLERWSVGYIRRDLQGASGFTESKYPIVPLSDCLVGTGNGYSIKPVAKITPHKMLKLNALTEAGLDTTLSKYVDVSEATATRFSLHKGDLLLCRSVGSYSHIAKCALVEEDHPDILYPDIIIRVRFKDTVLPEYVREVIQTKLGRAYFQSNARTSVGM